MKDSTPSGGDTIASPLSVRSRRSGRGRLFRWLLLLALVLIAFWQGPRLLTAFGNWWVLDEPPIKADAILVPEDGSYGGIRCRRGADLYRAGWAPYVVASGRYLRPYVSMPDMMQRDLIEQGVPQSAIVALPHSRGNEWDEAEATRALVESRGWKRLLIVTSNFQTRRGRRFYGRALGGSAEIHMVATPDPTFNPADWWKHRQSIAALVRECIYYVTSE